MYLFKGIKCEVIIIYFIIYHMISFCFDNYNNNNNNIFFK